MLPFQRQQNLSKVLAFCDYKFDMSCKNFKSTSNKVTFLGKMHCIAQKAAEVDGTIALPMLVLWTKKPDTWEGSIGIIIRTLWVKPFLLHLIRKWFAIRGNCWQTRRFLISLRTVGKYKQYKLAARLGDFVEHNQFQKRSTCWVGYIADNKLACDGILA